MIIHVIHVIETVGNNMKHEEVFVLYERLPDGIWEPIDCKYKSQLSERLQKYYKATELAFYKEHDERKKRG